MKISPLNKLLASVTFAAAGFAPLAVQAQTAAPAAAPAPASPFSFNVGLTSDYRYRGISQSRLEPAINGGADYAHSSGFYLGAWASSIKWIKDVGGGADVELDIYGGYKGEITKDLTYDVGVLGYVYPGNDLNPSANTTEVYGALTFSVATLKYSHSVTNLFGFANSKNSGYVDLSATFDLGSGWSLVPHVGYQKVQNLSAASYTDYSLSVSKDFGSGLSATLAAIGTNADKTGYVTPDGKFTGRNALVLSGKYAF
jgi:uncharacterized protein (TIGR02001 family)